MVGLAGGGAAAAEDGERQAAGGCWREGRQSARFWPSSERIRTLRHRICRPQPFPAYGEGWAAR